MFTITSGVFDVNGIKWLKDNKFSIMNGLRSAVKGDEIAREEINKLIALRHGACTLNLSASEVVIV